MPKDKTMQTSKKRRNLKEKPESDGTYAMTPERLEAFHQLSVALETYIELREELEAEA